MSAGRQGPERRVAERNEASLPVEFRCGQVSGKGRMVNISLSGACIEEVNQPLRGEEGQLTLYLTSLRSQNKVEVPAEIVRYTETGGFAVTFLSLGVRALCIFRAVLASAEAASSKQELD